MDNSHRNAITNGLLGKTAHVSPDAVFEAIDWDSVGKKPNGSIHSIWDILNHLIYWQDYCLSLLGGENPTSPEHAVESWKFTESPSNEEQWQGTVSAFLAGLQTAEDAAAADLSGKIASRPSESRIEVLESLIGHNSYHLGQIVLLRQLLGSWPPPSGGNTW